MKKQNKKLIACGILLIVSVPFLLLLQQKISLFPVQYNRNAFYNAYVLRERIHHWTLCAIYSHSWREIVRFWASEKDSVSCRTWLLHAAEKQKDPHAMLLLGQMSGNPIWYQYALLADQGRLHEKERQECRRQLEKKK